MTGLAKTGKKNELTSDVEVDLDANRLSKDQLREYIQLRRRFRQQPRGSSQKQTLNSNGLSKPHELVDDRESLPVIKITRH